MKEKGEKGRDQMNTPVKPIRKTQVKFDDDIQVQEFLNYTFSQKKTQSPGLNRVRELLKGHKRAKQK